MYIYHGYILFLMDCQKTVKCGIKIYTILWYFFFTLTYTAHGADLGTYIACNRCVRQDTFVATWVKLLKPHLSMVQPFHCAFLYITGSYILRKKLDLQRFNN